MIFLSSLAFVKFLHLFCNGHPLVYYPEDQINMFFLKCELTESSYVSLIVFSWDNRPERENGSPCRI